MIIENWQGVQIVLEEHRKMESLKILFWDWELHTGTTTWNISGVQDGYMWGSNTGTNECVAISLLTIVMSCDKGESRLASGLISLDRWLMHFSP